MKKFNNPLDHIKIASPCSADWNEMYGDNRQRFCGQCKLNVYNLSDMTKMSRKFSDKCERQRVCKVLSPQRRHGFNTKLSGRLAESEKENFAGDNRRIFNDYRFYSAEFSRLRKFHLTIQI